MISFLICLAITYCIAAGTLLTGRMVLAILNVTWLRRGTVANTIMAMFLGTSFWILTSDVCFHLSFLAPTIRFILIGAIVCLAVVVTVVKRWPYVIDRVHPRVLRNLAMVTVCLLVLHQFSIIWDHTYSPINDGASYLAMAEILQYQPASQDVPLEEHNPLFRLMYGLVASDWFHMGAVHLFAVVRAFVPGLTAYQVFPALAAWGVLLNGGAMYCLARWTLRLPRFYANLAGILPLVMGPPLIYSHDSYFFCQLFGTASFVLSMAVISRLYIRSHWNWGAAAVFGLTLAALLSTYGELTPLLTIGCLAFVIQAGWRATVQKRQLLAFLRFAGQATFCFVVMNNVGLHRTIKGILWTANLHGVGSHHDWSSFGFWGYALGAQGPDPVYAIYTVLVSVLFLIGLYVAAFRRQQAVALFTSLAFFFLLAMYYRFFVEDPWTGDIGHTWNLFKLGKYTYPMTATITLTGLWFVLSRTRHEQRIALVGCCLVGLIFVPAHLRREIQEARHTAQRIGPRAMPNSSEFRKRILGQQEGTLYCIGEHHPRDEEFVGSLIHPRIPKRVTWEELSESHDQILTNDMILMVDQPRTFKSTEPLPLAYALIDLQSTFLADVKTENSLEHDGNDWFCWIGDDSTVVRIWSHQETDATVRFNVVPGPSISETSIRNIWAAGPDKVRFNWEVEQEQVLSIPISLSKGLNTIEIGCSDQADPGLKLSFSRTLLARLSKIEISNVSSFTDSPSPNVSSNSFFRR